MTSLFLVTGASGFVGAAVAIKLRELGTVFGLARKPSAESDTRFISHDIAQPIPSLPCLKGATVIHCAAEIRAHDPQRHWATNVAGTKNILDWCARHDVGRLILFSTGGVYGYVAGRRMEECDPIRPRGIYAQTKYAAEREARDYAVASGLELVIFRLYFPFCRDQPSGIFRLVEDALRRKAPLQIKRDGAPRITPIHVLDAADAVSRAIDRRFPMGCYNLCGDQDISFLDLVRGKELRLGIKGNLVATDETSGDMMGSNVALKRSGWQPIIGLEEIIDPLE